jgi:hypothetical protein
MFDSPTALGILPDMPLSAHSVSVSPILHEGERETKLRERDDRLPVVYPVDGESDEESEEDALRSSSPPLQVVTRKRKRFGKHFIVLYHILR